MALRGPRGLEASGPGDLGSGDKGACDQGAEGPGDLGLWEPGPGDLGSEDQGACDLTRAQRDQGAWDSGSLVTAVDQGPGTRGCFRAGDHANFYHHACLRAGDRANSCNFCV